MSLGARSSNVHFKALELTTLASLFITQHVTMMLDVPTLPRGHRCQERQTEVRAERQGKTREPAKKGYDVPASNALLAYTQRSRQSK